MHLLPPVRFKKRLECPSCRKLTPLAEASCVHCGGGIPDKWRRDERRRLEKRRRHAWIGSAIVLPLLLVLLTLIFHSCGVESDRAMPFSLERAGSYPVAPVLAASITQLRPPALAL